MLFDSHAHLNDDRFAADLPHVLQNARENNVKSIMDIGWNKPTINRSLALSDSHSNIYSGIGFHPHEADNVKQKDMDWLKEKLTHRRCFAFGEIGLDYVRKFSSEATQQKVLLQQLDLALEFDLPVIFHSRGAEEQVLAMAISAGIHKAVFHCYTGSPETAKKIINRGYFLSFAGFITFKKTRLNWVKDLPLDRILIETDCPYIAPEPNRGKRNEPSFLRYTLKRLSEIVGRCEEEMAEITTFNAHKFYGLKSED